MIGNKSFKKKTNPPPPRIIPRKQNNGLMKTIFEGMTFGLGSSLGHRATDVIFGPRTINVETNQKTESQQIDICKDLKESYEKCLTDGKDCTNLIELLVKAKCN